MTRFQASTRMFLLLAVAGAAQAQPPPQPPAIAMSADECAVWARERSFAQSVEAHDAAAFAAHLHPGTVFIGGAGATRGADAVVAQWAPLLAADGPLRWHPERVVIGGDPDTALSMGPYWLREDRPGLAPRFRIGRFISVWKRDADGSWRVLFDGGGGNQARPATADEVAVLVAALPAACPRG